MARYGQYKDVIIIANSESFSELIMCQIQMRFTDIRNPFQDGFLGSFMKELNSSVLLLPLEHLWLESNHTREKIGPGIRGVL